MSTEFVIAELEIKGQPYVAEPPLRFAAVFNVAEKRYEIDGDFEIRFAERKLGAVMTRLFEEIEFSWKDIAQEKDPDQLTERAKEVKQEMLQRLRPKNPEAK